MPVESQLEAIGMVAVTIVGIIIFIIFYKWSSRYYKKQREKGKA